MAGRVSIRVAGVDEDRTGNFELLDEFGRRDEDFITHCSLLWLTSIASRRWFKEQETSLGCFFSLCPASLSYPFVAGINSPCRQASCAVALSPASRWRRNKPRAAGAGRGHWRRSRGRRSEA